MILKFCWPVKKKTVFLTIWEPFRYCKEKSSEISEAYSRFSCIFVKVFYIV